MGYNPIYTNTNSLKTQSKRFGRFLTNFIQNKEDYNDDDVEIEYQNLKLLDIRRNEHFGDVLMLSNERSPLSQIWTKIQKNSYFNMQQIKKLMTKVMKIFYKARGIYKKNEKANSNLIYSEIHSSNSSESENENENSKKTQINTNNNKLAKTIIKNLKTIKEVTYIEDSDLSNSIRNIEAKPKTSNNNLDLISENQFDSVIDSDSSNYNKKNSFRDDGTIKMDHVSNRNVDFSDVYSDGEMNKNIVDKRTDATPYKPFEINKEIYPNEINSFMKFTLDDNAKNHFKNNVNYNKTGTYINFKSKMLDKYNNNLNISICSTEISFSISSKYENIDELSDFKYSKTPKLRKKIKSILKDFENENEFEFSKYKTNKYNFKKTNISEDSFHKTKKNDEYKKSNSNDIFKRKKQKHHSKDKSSEDNIINITTLKNPNFNFLKLISGNKDKNTNNYVTGNELPTFNQLIQNVLNKEKLINHKELESEKEQLSKKLERIKTMKSQKKTSENDYKPEDFS